MNIILLKINTAQFFEAKLSIAYLILYYYCNWKITETFFGHRISQVILNFSLGAIDTGAVSKSFKFVAKFGKKVSKLCLYKK